MRALFIVYTNSGHTLFIRGVNSSQHSGCQAGHRYPCHRAFGTVSGRELRALGMGCQWFERMRRIWARWRGCPSGWGSSGLVVCRYLGGLAGLLAASRAAWGYWPRSRNRSCAYAFAPVAKRNTRRPWHTSPCLSLFPVQVFFECFNQIR